MAPLLVSADNSTPLAPSDVTKALQRVDPCLSLRWMPLMGAWAVTAQWRPSDPRHGLVQSGAIGAGASFDVVCHLPADCPVESAEAFLRSGFMSSSREDIVKMLDHLDQWNTAQVDANETAALAPILDDMESIAGRRLTNTAASFGGISATQPAQVPRKSRKNKGSVK